MGNFRRNVFLRFVFPGLKLSNFFSLKNIFEKSGSLFYQNKVVFWWKEITVTQQLKLNSNHVVTVKKPSESRHVVYLDQNSEIGGMFPTDPNKRRVKPWTYKMKFISLVSLCTAGSHLISSAAARWFPLCITLVSCRSLRRRAGFAGNAHLQMHSMSFPPVLCAWFPSCGAQGDETFMALAPACSSVCCVQSRYPCHAQTFQVSSAAQAKDVIAAFMVRVTLIRLSCQMDFRSVLFVSVLPS